MLFNPDPSKLAQEVLFSKKKKKRKKKKVQIHPILSLNNIQVERAFYQNHLGILLMKQHIDSAILKINTGMSVIKKFDIVCRGNP